MICIKQSNSLTASSMIYVTNKSWSWTKVLRKFTKTNAFELTIEFRIWTKTSLSSVVTPYHPNNLQKAPLGCFVVSNIEKGESGGFLSRGERAEFTPRKEVGNFHVSRQLLSMMTLLRCCWLSGYLWTTEPF